MTRRSKQSDRSNRWINQQNPYASPGYKPFSSVITPSTILKFGKYTGIIASEVLKTDPGYFQWLQKNTTIKISPELLK